MSSYQRLIINYNGTANDFKSECNLSMLGQDAVNSFIDYLGGLQGGAQLGAKLDFNVGALPASATFTVASGGSTNGQIGTLLNTNLTAKTSGAVPASGEFNISATPATQAASMVTAINAALAGKVLATRVGAIVTITALVPGTVGNGLQISAGNLSNVTAAAFANGSDGTAYSIDLR